MAITDERILELEQNALYLSEIRSCQRECEAARANLKEKSVAYNEAKQEWEATEKNLAEQIDQDVTEEGRQEYIETVRAAHQEVLIAYGKLHDAGELKKQAKKRLKEAEKNRDEVIQGGPPKPDPQIRLNFGDGEVTASAPRNFAPSRQPLSALGLSPAIERALHASDIDSLADLVALLNGEHPLHSQITNLPGIDEPTAMQIAEAYRTWQAGISQDRDTNTFEDGEGSGPAPLASEAVDELPSADDEEVSGDEVKVRVTLAGSEAYAGDIEQGQVLTGQVITGSFVCELDDQQIMLEEGEFEVLS